MVLFKIGDFHPMGSQSVQKSPEQNHHKSKDWKTLSKTIDLGTTKTQLAYIGKMVGKPLGLGAP